MKISPLAGKVHLLCQRSPARARSEGLGEPEPCPGQGVIAVPDNLFKPVCGMIRLSTNHVEPEESLRHVMLIALPNSLEQFIRS